MMKPMFHALCGLILAVSLGACKVGATSLTGVELILYTPNDGAIVPLGPIHISAFADIAPDSPHHPESVEYVFYANGIRVGGYTRPEGPGAVASTDWTPTEPGEYFIQFHADVGVRSAFSEAARICVLDISWSDVLGDVYGYEGPCEIPARREFTSPGKLLMEASASPGHLTYIFAGREPPLICPTFSEPVVNFHVTMTDPGDQVGFVVVKYKAPEDGGYALRSLILTRRGGLHPEKQFYGATEELNAFLERSELDSGVFEWTARAYSREGDLLLEDGPNSIPFDTCGLPPSTPTILSIPILVVSPTPGSESDCPPGTYFAPATNRCIQIQIVTKKPGGGGCSQYGDATSCKNAGCTWEFNQNSCH